MCFAVSGLLALSITYPVPILSVERCVVTPRWGDPYPPQDKLGTWGELVSCSQPLVGTGVALGRLGEALAGMNVFWHQP